MPKAHPLALRSRVVEAYENGEGSYDEIAERFKVGWASVNRWVNEHRRTGRLEAKPMGGRRFPRLIDEVGEGFIAQRLKDLPDQTLGELVAAYEEKFGLRVSTQRMSEAVRRLGLTRKRGSSDRSRA